jgi:hypothetical protein
MRNHKPDTRHIPESAVAQHVRTAAAGCEIASKVKQFVTNAFDPKPHYCEVQSMGSEWVIKLRWAGKPEMSVRCSK